MPDQTASAPCQQVPRRRSTLNPAAENYIPSKSVGEKMAADPHPRTSSPDWSSDSTPSIFFIKDADISDDKSGPPPELSDCASMVDDLVRDDDDPDMSQSIVHTDADVSEDESAPPPELSECAPMVDSLVSEGSDWEPQYSSLSQGPQARQTDFHGSGDAMGDGGWPVEFTIGRSAGTRLV